jgi:hypothetical protein
VVDDRLLTLWAKGLADEHEVWHTAVDGHHRRVGGADEYQLGTLVPPDDLAERFGLSSVRVDC